MWKTGRITTSELENPKQETVEAVHGFIKKWNSTHSDAQFIFYFGWEIFLNKNTFKYYSELVNSLKKIDPENELGLLYTSDNHYEEEDFLEGGFTRFSSNEILAETSFVINEKKTEPVGGHCTKCNAWHPLTAPKPVPQFIIDEKLLKNPMEELTKPEEETWDIIYDSTYILISSRFKQILETNDIKGYTLRPVISQSTGEESQKMFQLLANKSILLSALPEGETVQPFCDTCGAAHVPYEYDFAIRKEWIGDDDFFARDSYKGTSLHMSNRVFKLVREHQLTGLWPQAVVMVVSK